jgi:pyochelin biosynthetic protein PchC
LCFAAAGGSGLQFVPWLRWLPEGVSMCAVTLPRPTPHEQVWTGTLETIADEIVAERLLDPALPVVVLGHSLGALIGLAVARQLADESTGRLRRLVVAAAMDPRCEPDRSVTTLDDDRLLGVMRERYGGFEGLDVADPHLRRLVLPPLRADLGLLGTYRPDGDRPLDLPVTALTGALDPTTPPSTLEGWAAVTRGAFDAIELPGGHFFPSVADDAFRAAVRGLVIDARGS